MQGCACPVAVMFTETFVCQSHNSNTLMCYYHSGCDPVRGVSRVHRHERHWEACKPHLSEEPYGPGPRNSVTNVCKICINQGQRHPFELKLRTIIPNPNFMAQFVLSLLRLFSHRSSQTKYFSRWVGKKKKKRKSKRTWHSNLSISVGKRTSCRDPVWKGCFLHVSNEDVWNTKGRARLIPSPLTLACL